MIDLELIVSTVVKNRRENGVFKLDWRLTHFGSSTYQSTHTYTVEVYPRPDGTIYICGIGGSDYISTEDLKAGAFLEECNAKDARAEAAKNSFQQMS